MLNYKHLNYFHEVFTSGSIASASKNLNVTPQTISGQLTLLEEKLGIKLFHHKGRYLELTEAGKLVLERTSVIFQEGSELEENLKQFSELDALTSFRVGVSDLVPKSIVYKLLAPATQLEPPVRIVCTEGKLSDLLERLNVARNRMDLVIADSPHPPDMGNNVSHPLGSSGTSFFATSTLRQMLPGEFPHILHRAPMLLPAEGSTLRTKLWDWFSKQKVTPQIVGEFDDSALMREFGHAGIGVFVAPSVLRDMLTHTPEIVYLGDAEDIQIEFFAITARRMESRAVKAITKHAQGWLHKDKPRK
ncbi:MAG TPA: LysR family transcriptional regulator [Candidatus Thiothrix moscowensis]|uniref:LysR family transcriptional regulator n=1 Tax=unclassified Thiothrix TaxID=2636184 RepID=UPI001A1FB08C|nr:MULTISPECIES: LysR family transcriptional regulator [unclassified Thiothrix]MBJ6611218.1 LysR family transcriptional regulator [Candidatus Thiothrix moscowensis]HRJ54216.1 LysR family transcriptional regulator [Candidatus Thiothrix moscowensis]HRJ94482.1 LysR family transcriptional regulator [Candidatus Thiothrix moscowensis]